MHFWLAAMHWHFRRLICRWGFHQCVEVDRRTKQCIWCERWFEAPWK
jgi:hypothetical protein